ncbi:SdpI family protein [Caldisericum sp. AR60]|uniref:SdpI family protein n=1 Tax=unclassified Caldisericum TaxID=2641600 RepID=UPI0039FBCAA0
MDETYKLNKNVIRKEAFPISLIAVSYILGLLIYRKLPFFVPTSWDLEGHINAYLPKNFAITLLPTFALVLLIIFLLIPYIDPLRKNYSKFLDTYTTIINLLVALPCILQIVMLIVIVTGLNYLVPRSANLGVAVVYIVTGNFFPRIRQNWFIGVGTPWTMISEEIWKKTQRLAGFLLFILGMVCSLSIFVKSLQSVLLSVDWALVILVISSFYSFFLYFKMRETSNEISFERKADIFRSLIFTVVHIPYWIFML